MPLHQETSNADAAKVAIREFLQRMDAKPPQFSRDPELETQVKAAISTWPFPDLVRRHVITGVVLAETSYAHISDVDAKAAVALYTALLTILDNPETFEAVSAGAFYRMLCDGSVRNDKGAMGILAKLVADMDRFFRPFSASAILSATLRWLSAEMIAVPDTQLFVSPKTKEFVQYHRDMSGNPESFIAFIWSKGDFPGESMYIQAFPDMRVYINHANDILSFYKEELEGETTDYIHARARVTGTSAYETLHEVINEVLAALQRIEKVLGEGPVRDAWDSFKLGYIAFHAGDSRYRLQEVIGTTYMMDMSTF